jgi:hypothetical protein
MLRRSMLLCILLLAVLVSVRPAQALEAPIVVYVREDYSGTETGTEAEPYNTVKEATDKARNTNGGGVILIWQTDGYVYHSSVEGVGPGQTGLPIAGPVLYALLAMLSLILILAGWQFARRARRLQHSQ